MKKNLAFLTGIVFVLTILLAGGCGNTTKQSDSEKEENGSAEEANEPTTVDIFLKAVEIDGSWHLEMYDSKHDDCPAIDGLITEVNPEDTVYWEKAPASQIREVTLIRLMTDDYTLDGNIVEKIEDKARDELWTLIIPEIDETETIKYEIHFTVVGNDRDTIIIDPYLKIRGGG